MIARIDELVEYLKEKNDISLIQKHEIEIMQYDESKLEMLYQNYIHVYLNIHFGEKSISVVKNLLTHLRSIGAKKIAFNIEKDLFESFSTRKNLLKSLI